VLGNDWHLTIDEKSFIDWDNDLVQKNPIDFPEYLAKIESMKEKKQLAWMKLLLTGKATINGSNMWQLV
jgi:acetyl-CoA carboxylase carboxyl transferase subunit beta